VTTCRTLGLCMDDLPGLMFIEQRWGKTVAL
jgi:hypothetical protein